MKNIARGLVSKKKRRYRDHGFDLDLSYITPRIIATGFPSEGAEGMYRNPIGEVLRFLTKFHDKHYRIFNLCSERGYDPAKFGGSVERIPFDDHQPAPLELIALFCTHVAQWLDAHPDNVIVAHCKAGKGRTGMMICAFLVYSNYSPDPISAMQHYADKRTKNGKGVTIASQRRYIHYFHTTLHRGPRPVVELQLAQLRFTAHITSRNDIQFVISSNGGDGNFRLTQVLSSTDEGAVMHVSRQGKSISIGLTAIWLRGDVKVHFFDRRISKESSLFYFWFNTAFVDDNRLLLPTKSDLDKPSKALEADLQVEVLFCGRREPQGGVAANKLDNPRLYSSTHDAPRFLNDHSQTSDATWGVQNRGDHPDAFDDMADNYDSQSDSDDEEDGGPVARRSISHSRAQSAEGGPHFGSWGGDRDRDRDRDREADAEGGDVSGGSVGIIPGWDMPPSANLASQPGTHYKRDEQGRVIGDGDGCASELVEAMAMVEGLRRQLVEERARARERENGLHNCIARLNADAAQLEHRLRMERERRKADVREDQYKTRLEEALAQSALLTEQARTSQAQALGMGREGKKVEGPTMAAMRAQMVDMERHFKEHEASLHQQVTNLKLELELSRKMSALKMEGEKGVEIGNHGRGGGGGGRGGEGSQSRSSGVGTWTGTNDPKLHHEVMAALRDSIHRMQTLMKALKREQDINGRLNNQINTLLNGMHNSNNNNNNNRT